MAPRNERGAAQAGELEQRADAGMTQRRQRAGLALETAFGLETGCGLGGQHLDRDPAVDAGVARAEHLSHAAAADEREDLVRAEAGAGSQRHRSGKADYTVGTGPA